MAKRAKLPEAACPWEVEVSAVAFASESGLPGAAGERADNRSSYARGEGGRVEQRFRHQLDRDSSRRRGTWTGHKTSVECGLQDERDPRRTKPQGLGAQTARSWGPRKRNLPLEQGWPPRSKRKGTSARDRTRWSLCTNWSGLCWVVREWSSSQVQKLRSWSSSCPGNAKVSSKVHSPKKKRKRSAS